jgi:predicted DNA-binding transcriptional regulator YafY
MLAILWMLNSGEKITAKQISDKLEINIRTVYRYIDSLCASGVPIVSEAGQNGGYSLLNNFIHAPLFFDMKEQKALLHAAVFANEYSVEIEYRTGREEQPRLRVIDSYGMIFRIQQTQMIFKRPEGFSARKFFLQNLLPGTESEAGVVSIIIRGRLEALDNLCIHWFLGHHLKERTSNQAVFLIDERALHAYVPYFLLSYGKAIQVIEPQSLKKKLVSVATELLDYYQL